MKVTTIDFKVKKTIFSDIKNGPLIIEPESDENNDLTEWVRNNMDKLEKDLVQYGGLLFRGFAIDELSDFKRFIDCFNAEPIPYMFRSSPRHEIDKNVENIYTSTVYPRKEKIILHNESSYGRNWGMKIAFCCLLPAEKGGETPLASSRHILKDISEELVNKFKEKGLMYRRRLVHNLSMSWQEVFQTNSKEEVIKICETNNIKYHFHSDEHLDIEWVKPAVYTHPKTGEETWFNHGYFFNKYSRYDELKVDYDMELPSDFIFTDTLFGDGTPISIEEYEEIKNAYLKNQIQFEYQKGDIIFLDNMLMAHGRNPYEGDRTIATAILEPFGDNTVSK